MQVRLFKPDDLKTLALQSAQEGYQQFIDSPTYGEGLAAAGPCFTVALNGQILLCAGVQEHNAIRAEAWALLSNDAGPHMRRLTKLARGWFDQCQYQRVEANVATDFSAGHRWVTLLGFEQEGPERLKFFHDGRSAISYVRIK